MDSWGKVVGKEVDPLFLTIRDSDEKLYGILPFYLVTYKLAGIIPYRVLRILSDYASGMEYADWIVDEKSENIVTQKIAEWLNNCPESWDGIWMPTVASWTGIEARISRPCKEHGYLSNSRPRQFAVIDLPGGTDQYWSSLSANLKQQLRTQMKRILGKKDITVTQCTNKNDIPKYLDALFELHNKRWNRKGLRGSFQRKPNEELFYRRFAPIAHEKGWLRIFALQYRGSFKAVQFGYVYNGTFFQMQEGFDPDYDQGVGNVLRLKAIEMCIKEKLKSYDFMYEMTEHKRRWNPRERTGCDLLIGKCNLINRVIFGLNVWPTGRYLVPVDLPHGRRIA